MNKYFHILRLHKISDIQEYTLATIWLIVLDINLDELLKYSFDLMFISIYIFIGRTAFNIFDDIVDRKIDSKMQTKKHRPIASNLILLKEAWLLFLKLILLLVYLR